MTNEQKHREMWAWMAEHPGTNKSDYFDAIGISWNIMPSFQCYACEEADVRDEESLVDNIATCSYCPIVWDPTGKHIKDGGIRCMEKGSHYYVWNHPEKYGVDETTEAAREIASAEWHTDTEVQNE